MYVVLKDILIRLVSDYKVDILMVFRCLCRVV